MKILLFFILFLAVAYGRVKWTKRRYKYYDKTPRIYHQTKKWKRYRYVFVKKRMNWISHQNNCKQKGGELAIFYSKKQAKRLGKKFKSLMGKRKSFVGFRRFKDTKKWTWKDSRDFNVMPSNAKAVGLKNSAGKGNYVSVNRHGKVFRKKMFETGTAICQIPNSLRKPPQFCKKGYKKIYDKKKQLHCVKMIPYPKNPVWKGGKDVALGLTEAAFECKRRGQELFTPMDKTALLNFQKIIPHHFLPDPFDPKLPKTGMYYPTFAYVGISRKQVSKDDKKGNAFITPVKEIEVSKYFKDSNALSELWDPNNSWNVPNIGYMCTSKKDKNDPKIKVRPGPPFNPADQGHLPHMPNTLIRVTPFDKDPWNVVSFCEELYDYKHPY